jgi:methionyl-tRNA synthetase
MALDLSPPTSILTHAHWTLGKEKMSKSTGNVVNPFYAIDRFGVDVMRYYLAREGGIKDDASYDNLHIIRRYNHDLKGQLGNLVSRLTRSKKWSISDAIKAWQNTGSGGIKGETSHRLQMEMLETRYDTVKKHMAVYNIPLALNAIIDMVYQVRSQVNEVRRL